jgi:hypothetical protein
MKSIELIRNANYLIDLCLLRACRIIIADFERFNFIKGRQDEIHSFQTFNNISISRPVDQWYKHVKYTYEIKKDSIEFLISFSNNQSFCISLTNNQIDLSNNDFDKLMKYRSGQMSETEIAEANEYFTNLLESKES